MYLALAFVADADVALTALDGDPWRFVTAPFLNENGWYAVRRRCVGVAIFGWLLERRHGPLVVLLAVRPLRHRRRRGVRGARARRRPDLRRATAPRSALLAAWAVPDPARRAASGDHDEADLLGAAVLAASSSCCIPLAVDSSMLVAGLGLVIGALCGLLLAAVKPR